EQRYRRLRVLGANEGIGEVIGSVGVIRTLAHLGGQQWQCAFEVMPANERQAIVDGHVRACASNDVLVVNLRGFVEPALGDEGEEGPVEVEAVEFCRRRPGIANLALEPAVLLEVEALSKFPGA